MSNDVAAPAEEDLDFDWRYSTSGARRAIEYEQRTVMEMLGPLRGGVMLDVGTGIGKLINFPPPPEVIGVDPSRDELRFARARYSGDGSKHFVLGSADSLPFRDDAFEVVLGIRVIKFLEDPEAAVSEMSDVLKPGGRLIIDISNKFAPAAFIRRLESWARIHSPSRAYFSHHDGLKMMAAVGLMPFMSRPMFKVDPAFWRVVRSDRLSGLVEWFERGLDRRTGVWFLSRYVVIACEKPFSAPEPQA